MALIGACLLLAIEVFSIIRISTLKDKDLMVYHDRFLKTIKHYCYPNQYFLPKLESVRFYDTKNLGELAVCEARLNGFAIKFDRRAWVDMDESDRTQVMVHEMVHCMFNQDHVDDPKNFMSPYMSKMDTLTLSQQIHEYLSNKCGPPSEEIKK